MNGNELGSQFASAGLVVYFIDWLRAKPRVAKVIAALPWDDATIHRGVAVVSAIITSIGIHFAFEGDSNAGWHLSLTIPPTVELMHAAWFAIQQAVFQQFGYNVVQKLKAQ